LIDNQINLHQSGFKCVGQSICRSAEDSAYAFAAHRHLLWQRK